MREIAALWHWTPFLAAGFAQNLAISALAMALGTAVGTLLGRCRDRGGNGERDPGRGRPGRATRAAAAAATSLCRNVPSFVLMFYLALVLPVEIRIGGTLAILPLWLKAALALAIPVIGFASDQHLALRRQRRAGLDAAGATYAHAWIQYFLIILMASATASAIGADEIVGRAGLVIASDDRPAFLVATYLYVACWFITAAAALSALGGPLVAAGRGVRRAAR